MEEMDKEVLKGVACTIGGVVLLMALGLLPINRMKERSNIIKFEASRATVEIARTSGGIENAALAHKLVEANRWLANMQYWNSVWWTDIYIPDAVDEMKPIK